MATSKSGGSSKNGRDSASKRLGIKRSGGQFVKAGEIIVRQRGTKFRSGKNTILGKDHTVHAKTDGNVEFRTLKGKKYINIISA